MYFSVLQWAEAQGRIDELVSAAAAYNPSAERLRRFLSRSASRISYKPSDPIDAVLLPGGRPFFGRLILRKFIRQLLSNEPGSRVLFVDGPPGSGKSYTRDYLSYIAKETGRLVSSRFELSPLWSVEDLIGSIYSQLNLRWETSSEASRTRQIDQYAERLIHNARRSRLITMLQFDGDPAELQPDVVTLMHALEIRLDITNQVPLALVLTGFPFEEGLQAASRETLGYLSADELRWSIQRLAADIKLAPTLTDSDIQRITGLILDQAGGRDEGYNRRVQSIASRILSELVERTAPSRIYISYSHRDEALRERLEVSLAPLIRDGSVEVFSDRNIEAGEDWRSRLSAELDTADIILPLVSADFLNSSTAWDVEMTRALERSKTGEARVIPIILRPCTWQDTPLGALQALPRGGKPITSWSNVDEAFNAVADELRAVAGKIRDRGANRDSLL